MTSISSHIQKASLGHEVVLYQLDLTMFGQGILRLTPGTEGSSVIGFGGNDYSPLPIKAKGFAMSSSGPLPRPKISVSNIGNAYTALVENNDDLLGGVLTRIRTYDRYLDGGPDEDGDAHLPLDVYELSQKTFHNKEQISWTCKALMDQEGKMLPGRIISRDYCDLIYREHTGSGFDYSKATCPYTGSTYLDENGDPTTAANDACSKQLGSGCRARFGQNAELPFGGFSGVARLRAR